MELAIHHVDKYGNVPESFRTKRSPPDIMSTVFDMLTHRPFCSIHTLNEFIKTVNDDEYREVPMVSHSKTCWKGTLAPE